MTTRHRFQKLPSVSLQGWAAIVLAGIPLLWIAAYVRENARNVPFADQWVASTKIAIKTRDGTLSMGDLITQHNEHRIFFTHLTTAISTKVTSWDVRYETYVSVTLAALNLLLLGLLLRPRDDPRLFWAAIPISCMIFSFRQRVNWLLGFDTQHFFAIFFLLLAILIVSRPKTSRQSLLLASFFCLCSTYSFGAGILSWPLILAQLWLKGGRQRLHHLSLFTLTAALGLLLYFHNYHHNNLPQEMEPGSMIGYLFAFLGGPFVKDAPDQVGMAVAIGAFGFLAWGLGVAELLRRRVPAEKTAHWVALGLFGLGNGALAAWSRSSLGTAQALRSRYVTESSLFWISLIVIIFLFILDRNKASNTRLGLKPLTVFYLLLASLLTPLYFTANRFAATLDPLVSKNQERCLRDFPEKEDVQCLVGLHYSLSPRPELLSPRARATYWEKREVLLNNLHSLHVRRLSVFAEP